MRKISTLLFSIVVLMSVSACWGAQEEKKTFENMDLETYLEAVEFPDNLSVSFDPAEIESVPSAKIYVADFMELDPDTVVENLLRREIVNTKSQALGPWFQTGDESLTEYLMVLDGGKSFGKEVEVNGGVDYSVRVNGQNKKPPVITNGVGPPSVTEQLHRSLSRNDYKSFADLSFMSYEDALAKVEKQLYAIGFPKLEVAETYSMDVKTMREHYDYYIEENRDQEEMEEVSWSKDDERYIFHFRQLIDGIPVINVPWQWAKGTETSAAGNIMKYQTINVTFTKDGITNITARGLYEVSDTESGEEKSLIGAAEALQVMFEEYANLLLEEGTRVTSAELCYVSIPTKDAYELIPAWVFNIAKPDIIKNPDTGEEYPYDSYTRYVVNAVTGKKMSGMR